ncbi:hypothetical protein ACFCVO_12315 [Agromyces sp. NPDC056379]|uniref:PDC sensor domain-containing protein n=1 Tax=unclassified Agromyces TaxID=2639701 RepID=UPI0035DD97D0
MTTTVANAADTIAHRIAATIDPLFALIDTWRDVLEARLAVAADPTAAALDPVIAKLVRPALDDSRALITGAGFVAAPGFLSDAPWHLAWWLSGTNTFRAAADGGVRRLDAVSDPDAEQFRDYTTLEWWRTPARTGTRHLTGPYVDYLCTDDYTVTITTPVMVDGEMAGVVGTDAYVARLEQELLPVLRESGHPCTLVNASGRIVASTDSRHATGALLRLDGLASVLAPLHEHQGQASASVLPGGQFVVPCGDTTLALVFASA